MRDDIVEKALTSVRNDNPEPAAEAAALRRVGEALAAPRREGEAPETGLAVLRDCADLQALVPAYLAGRLAPSRALLLEDHTRSCVPCRRVLKAARSGQPAGVAVPGAIPSVPRRPLAVWALAASLLVGAALGALWLVRSASVSGPVARVDAVDGILVAPGAGQRVSAGAALVADQAVRTGRGGGAVLVLADGSRVELAERSELAIGRNGGGTTVALARGRVIVQAAKQRGGHLYVRTPDCLVSVTGTVFSVSQGTKGTRVSVLEGEVHVDDGGAEKVLHRGDQTATRGATARVALEEEFGWSRDRAAFLELVGEVARVRQELAATNASWSGRTSTRLLDAMPDGTVLYAALPNVSGTVADFYDRLAPRLASNPALASWWGSGPGAAERQAEVKRLLETLRTWGGYLGDEVAVGVGTNAEGRPGAPLVLTTVVRPGFREFLEAEIARNAGTSRVRVVERAADAPAASGDALLIWLHDDLVAAAPQATTLAALEAALAAPGGAFRTGTFHGRLAEAYASGVDLLLGVDVKALLARTAGATGGDPGVRDAFGMTGLGDVEHLIVERRSSGDESSGRAALTFSAERKGLAAWLAPPAPMGSLSFVSSGAAGALAVVTKEPALLVDDLFKVFAAGHPDFHVRLSAFEAEHGFRVRDDLAATLGGDAALAVDGPLLPEPAWKLVAEVYDPARLQATLERLVALAASEAQKQGKAGPKLVSETSGGHTFHSLVTGEGSTPLQYVFVDGYLVVAPQRALLARAIEVKGTGDTLLTAPKLTALLPKDGPLDFSMLAYQDVGGTLGSLATAFGSAPGSAASSLASAGASIAWAWAEPSRIVFGSSGKGLGDLSALVAAGLAAQSGDVHRPPSTRGK